MTRKKVPYRNKKAKKKKKNMFCQVIIYTLIIITTIFLGLLKLLNVIPNDYFAIITCFIVVITCILIIGILIKNKIRIFSSFISILLIIIYIFIIIYEIYTMVFLKNINNNDNVSTQNYNVIVLKSSNYKELKDINNQKLGILNNISESYEKAINTLNNEVSTTNIEKTDATSLADSLINKEVSAILIDSSSNEILKENYEGYQNNTVSLYDFTIEIKIESIVKAKDITKESYNIFISGIDTYGSISSVSRSDVNIIATINPLTNTINLTHIPRDYYVSIYNKNKKDKLTHAGMFGIDTSVKSVEQLMDIDINYYIKVNFTSIINIIESIGNIDVYSNYNFTTGIYDEKMTKTYTFKKGMNNLDGDQTLAFVRERHAFNDGDRVRGENQMAVLKAIIKKCTSPKILTNYPRLLTALSESFVTNLSDQEITTIMKNQLNENKPWTVESYELNGSPSYEYTYFYPNQKLYVMIPNETDLNESKEQLSSIYNAK